MREKKVWKIVPIALATAFIAAFSSTQNVTAAEIVSVEECKHLLTYTEPGEKASCLQTGIEQKVICNDCGTILEGGEIIPLADHAYRTVYGKATLTKSGYKAQKCSVCGNVQNKIGYSYPKTIALNKTSFNFSGKVNKPTVTVTCANGKTLSSTNYTLTYSNANSKNAGTYTVKVTFKGNYSGTKTLTYKINPAKVVKSVISANSVTVYLNGTEKRTYPLYSQGKYNGSYGGHRGCAVTSTAIVLSGMLNNPRITPETVHRGASTNRYSESYAITHLKNKYSSYDKISYSARIKKLDTSTPTNKMLAQILQNAGLKVKYVRTMTSKSVTEVTDALKKGNPVIFTTSKNMVYKGINLSFSYHTLVMAGIDENGYAIVINPAGGKVNYSHTKNKFFKFTPAQIINYFEKSTVAPTDLYDGGRFGYIIVSK